MIFRSLSVVNKSKYILSLLFISLLFPAFPALSQEQMLLRYEQSKRSDDINDPEIVTLGAISLSEGKVGNFDIINFQSDIEGEIWGFDFGLGYAFSSRGSPLIMYLGFGIMLGYNSDESDYIPGYYPSAGIIYTIKQGVGLTATVKRYYNVYDEPLDVIMYGIALKY